MDTTKMERIDIEELKRELAESRSKLDRWALDRVTTAHSLKDEHKIFLKQTGGKIKELEARQEQLSKMARELHQRMSVEDCEIEALRAELAVVRAEEEALPGKLEKLELLQKLEEEDFQRKQLALTSRSEAEEKELGALQRAINMFGNGLGLTFSYDGEMSEELQMIYTHIDPCDHLRQFNVTMMVLGNNQWKVVRCEPPIKSMGALLETLNATNNFSKFVRSARRQFLQLV